MQFRDEREQKSTIGVNELELGQLVGALEGVVARQHQSQIRQRKAGGGRKGNLSTLQAKVVFCLYYLKTYPTFDVLGNRFGLSRSSACEALHKWMPLVKQALEQLDVLPVSLFASPQAMHDYFAKKTFTSSL